MGKVLKGLGDAVDEMLFFLPQSSEAVCAKHLEGAEEDKEMELLHEVLLVYLHVATCGSDVLVNQFLSEFIGILRGCLPKEGCHIVVDGTASASLEINIEGTSFFQHHIACLKIPIHEAHFLHCQQIGTETTKILLQTYLMELYACELQIAVFEVVEVEHDARFIEILGRIALLIDIFRCGFELKLG